MSRLCVAFLAALACLLSAPSISASDSLRIAIDGHTSFTICLPEHPSANVRQSVDTLRRYFKEVTGAELTVGCTPSKQGGLLIVEVGASHSLRLSVAELGNDGFVIWTDHGNLCLTAATDYGFQNAVFTFLESYLGCRLFSPGVRVTPRRSRLVLPDIFDRQTPVFTFRMQNLRDASYLRWHKLNTTDGFGLFVHTFNVLVPPAKYFATHPEYFSLLNGNRTPNGQLCLSNPDVFRIVCDELRTRMKENPEARFWSVSQNDTYVPCQCAACRAIDSVAGSPSGSILTFVNRVADTFPAMTISTLAYQYSRQAPRNITPRPNVNIMLCSIECNRSQPLTEDPSSASFVQDVEDWSALGHNIFLWDYVINFRHLVSPFPNLRVLQPNLRFFADRGITTVYEQGLDGFGGEFGELRTYLLAKLLWNPDLNIDSVMDDFLTGYYGPAAPWVRQYIDTMHAVMQRSGESLDIYGYPTRSASGYLSAAMLDDYAAIFDRAEAAVADRSEFLSRVRTARLPVQYARLEQAKVAATGERGCFARSADGGLTVRPDMDTLLLSFVHQCNEAGIQRLWEHGTSPDEYYAATRRFLESGEHKHLARGKTVALASPASPKYHDGDKAALTDGLKGWDDYHMHWIGFEGAEMDATIDLGSVLPLSRIGTDFLQDINSWVFLPTAVTFSVSDDGVTYRPVGTVQDSIAADREGRIIAPFEVLLRSVTARYVRVQTNSFRTCPIWHKGSGGPAWIFIDEITVE